MLLHGTTISTGVSALIQQVAYTLMYTYVQQCVWVAICVCCVLYVQCSITMGVFVHVGVYVHVHMCQQLNPQSQALLPVLSTSANTIESLLSTSVDKAPATNTP